MVPHCNDVALARYGTELTSSWSSDSDNCQPSRADLTMCWAAIGRGSAHARPIDTPSSNTEIANTVAVIAGACRRLEWTAPMLALHKVLRLSGAVVLNHRAVAEAVRQNGVSISAAAVKWFLWDTLVNG
jgi:hypothetical protein